MLNKIRERSQVEITENGFVKLLKKFLYNNKFLSYFTGVTCTSLQYKQELNPMFILFIPF
jgi:hypothetical protein